MIQIHAKPVSAQQISGKGLADMRKYVIQFPQMSEGVQMGKLALNAMVLCMSAAFVLPAFAQGGNQDKPIATLTVNKGVVMTSTGGEYLYRYFRPTVVS